MPSVADTDYYATNPRSVGRVVEKSRKTPVCDAKLGKYRRFLGEGLSDTKRETSIIKDLRAAHPPHGDLACWIVGRVHEYNAGLQRPE